MMESMHYVNIFETKGLEYLLVISFLIGFVIFVRRLTYSRKSTVAALESEPATTAANPEMECPAGADCPHEQRRAIAREEGDQADKVVTS
ncbi:MAG: hypothetical protein DRQ45_07190 [Gammaproteobacteria bacterium]|nr:MAG: hypothetical protein DRQ45_07190 [Gammaproteobacteria bacterium]